MADYTSPWLLNTHILCFQFMFKFSMNYKTDYMLLGSHCHLSPRIREQCFIVVCVHTLIACREKKSRKNLVEIYDYRHDPPDFDFNHALLTSGPCLGYVGEVLIYFCRICLQVNMLCLSRQARFHCCRRESQRLQLDCPFRSHVSEVTLEANRRLD